MSNILRHDFDSANDHDISVVVVYNAEYRRVLANLCIGYDNVDDCHAIPLIEAALDQLLAEGVALDDPHLREMVETLVETEEPDGFEDEDGTSVVYREEAISRTVQEFARRRRHGLQMRPVRCVHRPGRHASRHRGARTARVSRRVTRSRAGPARPEDPSRPDVARPSPAEAGVCGVPDGCTRAREGRGTVRASAHARARSDEWHAREHSVGTAARLAIKAGALVLPYPDQPCKAMVIALDGRRRIANLHTDEIITSLPRLPDHFRFATRRSTA